MELTSGSTQGLILDFFPVLKLETSEVSEEFRVIHGQALLLDSYVVKKILRSVQHEAGNLGPKLQPRGGFFGP